MVAYSKLIGGFKSFRPVDNEVCIVWSDLGSTFMSQATILKGFKYTHLYIISN